MGKQLEGARAVVAAASAAARSATLSAAGLSDVVDSHSGGAGRGRPLRAPEAAPPRERVPPSCSTRGTGVDSTQLARCRRRGRGVGGLRSPLQAALRIALTSLWSSWARLCWPGEGKRPCRPGRRRSGAATASDTALCFSSVLRVGRRCLTAEPAAAGFMPPEPRLGMEGMLGGGRGGHHSCRGQLFQVLLP